MSEIKPVATWETHCKRNPSCAEQAHLYASEAKSIEIEELRAAYEALQKELTHWKANHAELEQKEKVLDRLINEFEGKHKFVGTRRVHKKLPRDLRTMENAATICAEHVDVFQWVLRADGEHSFKQAVMNLLSQKNGDSK